MINASALIEWPKSFARLWATIWERFWFTPTLPDTLCVLRIVTGAMLLYAHLVLATDLLSFVGTEAWINNETARQLHDGAFGLNDWGRSYLWRISSPGVLWVHHGVTIIVTFLFMIGCLTRITAPAAWFLQLMYIHRLTGALFGLDQIVTYSVMYMMLTPCGSRFSVDAWLRERFRTHDGSSRLRQWIFPQWKPSISATVGTRLMQIHLCIIYLFGGLAKARGDLWWDGTAVWYAVANFEYQSMDMTWLAKYPSIVSFLTNITLFWEIFYIALVWPRATRPFVLAMAIAVHGGIALFLGMATFGVMMIAANCIFVPPEWIAGRARGLLPEESEQFAQWNDESVAGSSSDPATDTETTRKTPTVGELRRAYAKLKRRKARYTEASAKLKRRSARLKEREEEYKSRVRRLRKREERIKSIVEKRRDRKASESELTRELDKELKKDLDADAGQSDIHIN
ncbi:HTTM domain-containing protein [Stieleria varia]|uniref:Vitamin K-dependent gamma-carboxylase n=1 Tax=Stieleria varia TaxID=2528005 RepID=A0A5C6A3B6_9BACT|nr:HTTM domain-containing protein [Stieleria varia]TWT93827.1 Vitamin K-dependent gamma-carboxylase [Stieleria varia]